MIGSFSYLFFQNSKLIQFSNFFVNPVPELRLGEPFPADVFPLTSMDEHFRGLPGQIGFQASHSPVMEAIVSLHHTIFACIIFIVIVVIGLLASCFYFYSLMPTEYVEEGFSRNTEEMAFQYLFVKKLQESSRFTHHTLIEILWTLLPGLILIYIALPSFSLLYAIDEIHHAAFEVRIVGHQWYWTYESYMSDAAVYPLSDEGKRIAASGVKYNDVPNVVAYGLQNITKSSYGRDFMHRINFDSFLVETKRIPYGYHRYHHTWFGWCRTQYKPLHHLLEVDTFLIVPIRTFISLIVSAADVLHSWAIPSLGIKIDAIPGRLNLVNLYIFDEGMYHGQCSEICGINHGFMPIAVMAISQEPFYKILTYHNTIFNTAIQSYPLFDPASYDRILSDTDLVGYVRKHAPHIFDMIDEGKRQGIIPRNYTVHTLLKQICTDLKFEAYARLFSTGAHLSYNFYKLL
jgi:cytochrome c oxidase subunit 2